MRALRPSTRPVCCRSSTRKPPVNKTFPGAEMATEEGYIEKIDLVEGGENVFIEEGKAEKARLRSWHYYGGPGSQSRLLRLSGPSFNSPPCSSS